MRKSRWNDGHASKSAKDDGKEKEPKRETDGTKEKDRYKEKYSGKSIQELDLSNCKRCTPSYRLLPDDVGHWSIGFPNMIIDGRISISMDHV